MCKHLTKIKKYKKFSYLNELNAQALQEIINRIDLGYKRWWRDIKAGIKSSPPKFKKVSKYSSFTLSQSGWKIDEENGVIWIQKKKYKYYNSRKINGKIKTVTVKRDNLNNLWLYFVVKQDSFVSRKTFNRKITGFDYGFKDKMLISFDKTEDICAPSFFRKNKALFKEAAKKLDSKPFQSNNKEKAKIRLAKLHKKVLNQRKDYHWKLSHYLCSIYSLICLESLNQKFIFKKNGKKATDYGFATFVTKLIHVAIQNETKVSFVDRFFPSSQLCSNCGYKNEKVKKLSVRRWTCPSCGVEHDRDRNAALNICSEGFKKYIEKR